MPKGNQALGAFRKFIANNVRHLRYISLALEERGDGIHRATHKIKKNSTADNTAHGAEIIEQKTPQAAHTPAVFISIET